MTTTTAAPRKFGVEIEFKAQRSDGTYLDRDDIARELRNAGIATNAESYNHITRSYWKVITDQSCGYEVVSPILEGEDGFGQITKVCAVLNRMGAIVDKTCGLHVHVDADGLNNKQIASILATYARDEKFFDAIQPESRRADNNRYCHSVAFLNTISKERAQELTENPFEFAFCQFWASRYAKINLDAYSRHGTIEFRQAAGTTDADKIINWVVLVQTVVTVAAASRVQFKNIDLSVSKMKLWLKISENSADARIAECSRWIDARFAKLNPGLKLTTVL